MADQIAQQAAAAFDSAGQKDLYAHVGDYYYIFSASESGCGAPQNEEKVREAVKAILKSFSAS